MNLDKLAGLKIDPGQKRRSSTVVNVILVGVVLVTAIALFYARPWSREGQRVFRGAPGANSNHPAPAVASSSAPASSSPFPARGVAESSNVVLTVSGYIVNRERIELSPRFMGVVRWIGVKKGDAVTNGQTVALLDDAEYQVRLAQDLARLSTARIATEKARIIFDRVQRLGAVDIESKQAQDDARLAVEAAEAAVREIEAKIAEDRVYLEWTVIRSPINGVILEKLVDANELVTPQTFGGTRGPSASLLALADPSDLQVEIELNEADLAKVRLKQTCRIIPEAYPDRSYPGFVAEMAPEANRQKGTLQVKVQILNPDRFLTPELSARVDFEGAAGRP
ncbi:MAG: efflux RND transporter periplasmic adaptor subunit [Verrucomicrobiota bacterium]